ncbi:MAG: UvrB/UvrC motif-containing protein [Eubacteriales bacterium]
MLCEKCNKKKATVFYNENINGKVRSFNLCADCAKAMRDAGELEDISASFASFASPFLSLEDSFFNDFFSLPFHTASGLNAPSAPKKCPLCGATLSDISTTGKVGCAKCYETFADELEGPIQSAHGKTGHIGRIARGHRTKKEKADRISALKKQLKEAINDEKFEEAASLRDQIHELEGNA